MKTVRQQGVDEEEQRHEKRGQRMPEWQSVRLHVPVSVKGGKDKDTATSSTWQTLHYSGHGPVSLLLLLYCRWLCPEASPLHNAAIFPPNREQPEESHVQKWIHECMRHMSHVLKGWLMDWLKGWHRSELSKRNSKQLLSPPNVNQLGRQVLIIWIVVLSMYCIELKWS